MKLSELFHRPTKIPGQAPEVFFDSGDLVVVAGEPGTVLSGPDSKGVYKVRIKASGKTVEASKDEIEMP